MRQHARSFLSAAVLVVIAAAAAAQDATFVRDDYRSAAGARGVVTADFNRDGWADAAHANLGSDSVSVLLNARGARLELAATVAVGAGPFGLAAADLNGDGIPDLAVANADADTLSVLLGRGDGRFTRADISTLPFRSPRGIAAADVSGDGRPDLVFTAYASGAVAVLLGSGTGTFAAGWTESGTLSPQGVAAADFNRDGRSDIAVAHAGGLTLYYGTAGGTFSAAAVPGERNLNVLAAADLDADGWMDVLAASTGRSRLGVYRGTPAGLVFARGYQVDWEPRGIAAADVNGDGVLDAVTANRTSDTVNVFFGDPGAPGRFSAKVAYPAASGARAVAAADLDHDGRIDLVIGNEYRPRASVFRNTTFLLPAAYAFERSAVPAAVDFASRENLAAADFDSDGRLDFVQRAADVGRIAVVLSSGATVTLLAPGYAGHLVADVDGDTRADVLVMGAERIQVFLSTGGGDFPVRPTTPLGGDACVAGDMNRDSRLDLVCIGTVLLGNGDGTFRRGATFTTAGEGDLGPPRLADLNRDGALDIVVPSGETWLGDGEGGVVHGAPPAIWSSVVEVVDLNHDGYPDLVVSDGATTLGAALGGANGFATVEPFYFQGLETSTSLAIGDLNVDGHPDVLLNYLAEDADTMGVLRFIPGRGDGTFGPPEAFAFRGGEILVADVTADGLPDVVTTRGAAVHVLVNARREGNRAPMVTASDITVAYRECIVLPVTAVDPDSHALRISWSADAWPSGELGELTAAEICPELPGDYAYSLTADDGRGGVVTRHFVVTVVEPSEIYLDMRFASLYGLEGWSIESDPSAARGIRLYNRNAGAPKVTRPLAAPPSFVELRFRADAARAYKLWARLKADGNSWANDSLWIQFSGSTALNGVPAYRIGTPAALPVNLEECANCGVSGWGWEDDGWGSVDANGVMLRFPDGGWQTLRIQTREDGVSVDQIVLSSERYVSARPGAAKNDTTILTGDLPR